jgi:hypothetical protein
MTITITKEIERAYEEFLDEPVDGFVDGKTIRRRDTFPYDIGGAVDHLVSFAGGWEAKPSSRSDRPSIETSLQVLENIRRAHWSHWSSGENEDFCRALAALRRLAQS